MALNEISEIKIEVELFWLQNLQPGDAEQTKQAEENQRPAVEFHPLTSRRNERQDPSFKDHEQDETRVEPEPIIFSTIPFKLEGLETYPDLDAEEAAEEVLHEHELRLGQINSFRRILILVNGYPQRIDDDDSKSHVFENSVFGKALG